MAGGTPMKLLLDNLSRKMPIQAAAAHAFTLAEMMTTMAIFSMVVLAMVSLQIFGFKMNSFTSSKLIYTGYILKTLDQICNQVRGASLVQIGNGSSTSFTTTGTNGNALQVYPTTNLNNYIRFYLATNTAAFYNLYQLTNGGQPSLIASNIIGSIAFQMEDYQGSNIVAGSTEHYTIGMTLQFSQLAYSDPIPAYDYYTLQTLMTPRMQN
jgi:prepilin-type N-terminal cleavage/methylation domain-containing protein